MDPYPKPVAGLTSIEDAVKSRSIACLRNFGGGQLGAHLVDSLLVVLLRPGVVEDGRSRHEHVCARLRDFLDVGHAAPTVHLFE